MHYIFKSTPPFFFLYFTVRWRLDGFRRRCESLELKAWRFVGRSLGDCVRWIEEGFLCNCTEAFTTDGGLE